MPRRPTRHALLAVAVVAALKASLPSPLAAQDVPGADWIRFEPRPMSDAPPEPLLAPPTSWPGAPAHEVSVRALMLRHGLPRVERAELRDVVVRGDAWSASRIHRRRALVEPARDGGSPWALHDGLLRPVDAMGPLLDLEEECEAALELHERASDGGARQYDLRAEAHERCPMTDAWPVLSERGRSDLVERYFRVAPKEGTRALLRSGLGRWVTALARHARALFEAGLHRRARREVVVLERAVSIGERLGALSRRDDVPELNPLRRALGVPRGRPLAGSTPLAFARPGAR